MTVFTTSSPRQISFQIWFLYENASGRHPKYAECCANRRVCVCKSKRSSMKASRRWLKMIQLDASGWTQRWELPTERQRRESVFFSFSVGIVFEAVKAYSEETVRTSSLTVVSLCRRNLGSFKWVSHHWKGDSLSLLYTLSIQFFIRLCKHKKCSSSFFVVAQFSLICKSVRSYLYDEQVNAVTQQHVGIVTVFSFSLSDSLVLETQSVSTDSTFIWEAALRQQRTK